MFDGHNDVLERLDGPAGFFERREEGHLDLPRAREGGFGGGMFAVWVPPPEGKAAHETLDPSYALRHSLSAAATLFRIEKLSEGQVRIVRSAAEIRSCINEGILAAVLHMEGADAIDTDLDALHVLHRAGLRSLGIVWSRPNAFAEGVRVRFGSTPDTGAGLTEAGRRLVRTCNELGIVIDVSHLNERGFWDVAELSEAPLVATHSNAHAICPSPRNLTDAQLEAIAASDGMVGLNFGVHFLREDGSEDTDTPIEVMVRHIDHLVEHLGMERVGFGSDFDGIRIPDAIGDVRGLPRLMQALREHGYGEEDLKKIAHENWLRVLRKTWGR
ncbi:dipeptidase [Rubrobacter calidifluminis]|uniref:dipeptidase n=1 Tax=Rubrobacter calidifluminis TaxID=1392640 RepID=UPI00235F8BC4|nr:dipeptidase [Rubrobacter calidifluminis]